MHRSPKSRSSAGCLAAALLAVSFLGFSRATVLANEPAAGGTPYADDPQHLWNRLHEALFVRVGPDSREYGRDRLDPLLWTETRHFVDEQSRDRLVALLEEFLGANGQKLVAEPLRRAVLQRDLWLIFNWLQRDHGHEGQLAGRLASAIGRLALTSEQIEALPDSYAAAVASGEFATRFDAEQPNEPYLPPDLFVSDGPWVCVGRPDGPVAPQHLREDGGNNPSTNSVFLVFLRLPGGRGPTLAFLKQLRAFDQPLVGEWTDVESRKRTFLPNDMLPQIPVGTEMALVRRAILIDSSHTPVASSLCESVQLRVYREIPGMTTETLDASLGGGTAANRRAQRWQSFFEFRLSRPLLFAGRAGGLRAIDKQERDFKTGFRSHGWDPFERRDPGRPFPDPDRLLIRQGCFACHSLPGVMSFSSFSDDWRGGIVSGKMRRPAALSEVSVAEATASGIEWKKNRPNWIALRDLLSK